MAQHYDCAMQEHSKPDAGTPEAAQDEQLKGARARLEAGDRFPEFTLPDQHGKLRYFTERARGEGLLLMLDPDQDALKALKSLTAEYAAARLDRMAIVASATFDPGFPLLADGAGKIRASLREISGRVEAAPLAFLLDRNQRILALRAGADLPHWALGRWQQEARAEPARQITEVAPILLVPNVLTRAQCRALVERWETAGNEPGFVTSLVEGEAVRRVYEDLKKRRDHRLSDPAVKGPLLSLIGRRIAPELDKAFRFRRFAFDRVLIVCYDSERGDYFRRHRDNQTPATANRQFALTLNLNSEEYEGGELIFPEYGDHRYKPPTGGAILFSCSLLHEALPVLRGQRFALLTFLRDASQG